MTKKDKTKASIEVTIPNKLGLHARAAALLRECAQVYKSNIKVIKDHMEADAKSLLGLIALGAAQGCTIKITAVGVDAAKAIEALKKLVESGFNEKE